VNRMIRMKTDTSTVNPKTLAAISWETEHRVNDVRNRFKAAVEKVIHRERLSKFHYRNQYNVSNCQHLSVVDAFNGGEVRKGRFGQQKELDSEEEDILVISPMIDGRFKDVGRDAKEESD